MKVNKELLKWLLSDDTGVSSITLCGYMLGIEPSWKNSPSDKGDRGRCIRMLKTTPEWIDRLDEMKKEGVGWGEQIELIKKELK